MHRLPLVHPKPPCRRYFILQNKGQKQNSVLAATVVGWAQSDAGKCAHYARAWCNKVPLHSAEAHKTALQFRTSTTERLPTLCRCTSGQSLSNEHGIAHSVSTKRVKNLNLVF